MGAALRQGSNPQPSTRKVNVLPTDLPRTVLLHVTREKVPELKTRRQCPVPLSPLPEHAAAAPNETPPSQRPSLQPHLGYGSSEKRFPHRHFIMFSLFSFARLFLCVSSPNARNERRPAGAIEGWLGSCPIWERKKPTKRGTVAAVSPSWL